MQTLYQNRLILIIPANRCAALNAWVKANIDPTGADWFTPTLSANGQAPATHAWANFALTDEQSETWWTRLTQISGMQKPANWKTMTRQEKKTWVISNRAAIQAGAVVKDVEPIFNTETWTDPQTVLTRAGLQLINVTLG